MTWIITCTAREQDLHAPTRTGIDGARDMPPIHEIAHSLALINRFNGHTSRHYSVAEHSLLVADIAEHELQLHSTVVLAALMHDAHESIVGDMATPVKHMVGSLWGTLEHRWERAIATHFGHADTAMLFAKQIKKCDLIALATERRDLLPFDPARHQPWPVLEGIRPTHTHIPTEDQDWRAMRDKFLERYDSLATVVDSGWGAIV